MKTIFFLILALGSAVCVYAEDVAIVVAKSNKLQDVTLAELYAILHCDKQISPSGAKWIVYLRAKKSPEHEVLLKNLFKSSADALESYYMQGEFNGSIDPSPKTVSSAAVVLRNLSANAAGISYLKASEVTDAVRVLKVNGALPGEGNYPLKGEN